MSEEVKDVIAFIRAAQQEDFEARSRIVNILPEVSAMTLEKISGDEKKSCWKK